MVQISPVLWSKLQNNIRIAKSDGVNALVCKMSCVLRPQTLQLACFLKSAYLSLEAGEEINRDKSWIESCVLNRLAAD